MSQQAHDSDAQSQLLQELRLHFPPEHGYEVEAAEWIQIVDDKLGTIPVTTVRGNGVDLTLFPRAPHFVRGPGD